MGTNSWSQGCDDGLRDPANFLHFCILEEQKDSEDPGNIRAV